MMHRKRYRLLQVLCLCCCLFAGSISAYAQPELKKYSIREGKEVIEISRRLPEKELDDFIRDFDLADLDLKNFIRHNVSDSLAKRGWLISVNNKDMIVITRFMHSFDIDELLMEKFNIDFLTVNNNMNTAVRFGVNKVSNRYPFLVRDSVVTFFLKNNRGIRNVKLAGSFTNWQHNAISMLLTDSGWIANVKLPPGKHWYKFILDGNWITDPASQLNENDGEGNINSVYYKTNYTFRLNGFTNAKKVFLSGSFNDWKKDELQMMRTAQGWELPLLLPDGTHTYKFIADGTWLTDDANPERLPDSEGNYNSVIRLGNMYTFHLKGFTNASKVFLSGSFNNWKHDELQMTRTADGWELPYSIGPGNYEYKFVVDGNWMPDPSNNAKGHDGNSFLVIAPNYKFKLFAPDAKKVMLAGDFNNWDPNSIPMQQEGDSWVFRLYLAPGKHRYKFIVDGQWIIDPQNKLWEQNEHNTGNSIIWIGEQK